MENKGRWRKGEKKTVERGRETEKTIKGNNDRMVIRRRELGTE